MTADWNGIAPDLQLTLSREALGRARQIIGAQAEVLADQMDRGALPCLDGPDALRLLATLLGAGDGFAGACGQAHA